MRDELRIGRLEGPVVCLTRPRARLLGITGVVEGRAETQQRAHGHRVRRIFVNGGAVRVLEPLPRFVERADRARALAGTRRIVDRVDAAREVGRGGMVPGQLDDMRVDIGIVVRLDRLRDSSMQVAPACGRQRGNEHFADERLLEANRALPAGHRDEHTGAVEHAERGRQFVVGKGARTRQHRRLGRAPDDGRDLHDPASGRTESRQVGVDERREPVGDPGSVARRIDVTRDLTHVQRVPAG